MMVKNYHCPLQRCLLLTILGELFVGTGRHCISNKQLESRGASHVDYQWADESNDSEDNLREGGIYNTVIITNGAIMFKDSSNHREKLIKKLNEDIFFVFWQSDLMVFISGQRFALASLINGWYGHSLRRRRWWGAGRFCKNRALDARGPWLHVVLRPLNLSLRSEVTSGVS